MLYAESPKTKGKITNFINKKNNVNNPEAAGEHTSNYLYICMSSSSPCIIHVRIEEEKNMFIPYSINI